MDRPSPLVGTWRLIVCEHRLPGGRRLHPFGRRPGGRLIYSPDGWMMVMLMARGRKPSASSQVFEATDAERADAARGFLGYSARWRVRGGTVVHDVDVSLFPNWLGRPQVRRFSVKGRRVTFTTGPFLVNGVRQTARLVWERA